MLERACSSIESVLKAYVMLIRITLVVVLTARNASRIRAKIEIPRRCSLEGSPALSMAAVDVAIVQARRSVGSLRRP